MTSLVQKALRLSLVVALILGVCATPALASTNTGDANASASAIPQEGGITLPSWAAIGAGLVTMGGAAGIGKLAAAAMEGTARQPEAGGDIRTSMIIAAALIEGFTFFALIVCFMAI